MEPLIIDRSGHVETWTLNLPEERNPISGEPMIEAIEAAARRVHADPEVRAVILTGAGSAFSGGGNVKDLLAGAPPFGGPPHRARDDYRRGIQRIPLALTACEVPLIAAVNGPAIGAGCDLALMCDLRIASTSAVFAESFVQLGIIPGDGGAWFLPRIVGPARAAEMILTGDRIETVTALDWGLVNQVVEPAELLPAAHALADRIIGNAPLAVRMAKRLLRETHRGAELDSALELAASLQAIAQSTEDFAESVCAIRERRRPEFRGR
ncbi:MAG: crotonase/enoyl-CoA hydratase family protein [Propionibacteriaceae bacterium]|nr:crotonase/enoyl-CoA hydratase family protein [Propionibacteriaceae bacterium]